MQQATMYADSIDLIIIFVRSFYFDVLIFRAIRHGVKFHISTLSLSNANANPNAKSTIVKCNSYQIQNASIRAQLGQSGKLYLKCVFNGWSTEKRSSNNLTAIEIDHISIGSINDYWKKDYYQCQPTE